MSSLKNDALGLYLSIPFCRSKCTYCNFASGVYPASDHVRYVGRLIEDMKASAAWAIEMGVELPRRVDSVYLGGGTPSLLAAELFTQLFAAMRAEFEFEPDAEVTVECAPGQIADETLAAMVAVGVNRVSLGVQSFIDREAQVSGRLHSRAITLEDIRRLRAAGIPNLSVDLIAGLAGQTAATFDESLSVLIDTGVPHASLYMLEVDEDSRLGREMLAGGLRYYAESVPSDDAIALMYTHALERLGQAGLQQYEISNFCTPGFASRHNLRYWQRRPYLGLGLDASSMLHATPASKGRGASHPDPNVEKTGTRKRSAADLLDRYVLRTTTTDDLKEYLSGPQPVETGWLSLARQHEEAWFLGLRMNAGVNIAALKKDFGVDAVGRALLAVSQLKESGLLTTDRRTVSLTAQGRLLSNDVFQEFLEHAAEEVPA